MERSRKQLCQAVSSEIEMVKGVEPGPVLPREPAVNRTEIWNFDEQMTAASHHLRQIGNRAFEVVNMLQHIERKHAISVPGLLRR